MPGPAPKPKAERRTRHKPIRGEWQAAPGIGWQHGPIPPPPDGCRPATALVWQTWMRAWWASHWLPEDLPGLEQVARLYDQCEAFFEDPYTERATRKGDGDTIFVLKPNPASELRQLMDNYGITPKGQQDRRWEAPKAKPETAEPATKPTGRYGHLRAVGED
jgi:hypothetical protein